MKRALVLTALLGGMMIPGSLPAADANFWKQVGEIKIVKEYYPGPYERLLDTYRSPEDRILAVFHAQATARADKGLSGIAFFLDRALSELHRTQCAVFKLEVLSDADPAQRLADLLTWWKAPARPEDRAAFAQVFRILPPATLASLGLEAMAVEAGIQEEALKAPETLARYAASVPAKQQYTALVRKSNWWNTTAKSDLEKLTARIRFAFSTENLLRFLGRARAKASSPKLQGTLAQMQDQLTSDLLQEIRDEFRSLIDDQLFGSEITFIGQASNNGIQTKESLIKGRLRLLVKRAQLLETRIDRQIFIPLFERIGTDLSALSANAQPKAREYASMVKDTLQLLTLVKLRGLEAEKESETTAALFKQIGRSLSEQDKTNLTEGLSSLF